MHTSVHRVTNYENVVYKHMKIEDCFLVLIVSRLSLCKGDAVFGDAIIVLKYLWEAADAVRSLQTNMSNVVV